MPQPEAVRWSSGLGWTVVQRRRLASPKANFAVHAEIALHDDEIIPRNISFRENVRDPQNGTPFI
jgi:hypothetical protein